MTWLSKNCFEHHKLNLKAAVIPAGCAIFNCAERAVLVVVVVALLVVRNRGQLACSGEPARPSKRPDYVKSGQLTDSRKRQKSHTNKTAALFCHPRVIKTYHSLGIY